ncbi:MAG: polyprenyl synthetase family protein [Abitibacteriaceae bacterium]|nr:polyprenyl synthetase family protein [Abditibacteriaceae bacterium]
MTLDNHNLRDTGEQQPHAPQSMPAAVGVVGVAEETVIYRNGSHPLPEVRPDVQQTVVEAVEVANERGGALSVHNIAASNGLTDIAPNLSPATDKVAATSQPIAEPDMPRTAPWNQLSADAVSGVRRVNIMAALAGIQTRMKAVETELEHLITTPVKLIADIASHTLSAGGKRLRPALALLAAQVCGDVGEVPNARVVTCAAAVELTHTTTLLHDDVVDAAETRRGKPTANLIWGNETSVLVGDYLFAQVFVTASQQGFADLMYPLAHATAEMCAGELLETQTRGNLGMKEKQYLDIIALKTASLTDCACRLGAMAMNAPADAVEKLARFGRDVGMAFQIVDDVFDVVATEGRVGKPVGNDIREGDITLPMLRAMQVCSETEKQELQAIIGKSGITDEEVERALTIMRSCDAVPYSLGIARNFITSAKAQLVDFEPSTALTGLCDIADYVVSRDR